MERTVVVMAYFKVTSNTCLKRLRKTMKTCQDSQYSSNIQTRFLLQYKSAVLVLELSFSVISGV
jgi:hypothetical protein